MVVRTERISSESVSVGAKRGTIVSFGDDGLVLVALENDQSRVYPCELLENDSLRNTPLQSGDKVIFLPPDSYDTFGCILGRVTRHRPKVNDIIDQSEEQIQKISGRQIEIHADSGLLLKCGKGSISIKEDGTIIVKGSRLLSRSSGINKIKGAAVQIN